MTSPQDRDELADKISDTLLHMVDESYWERGMAIANMLINAGWTPPEMPTQGYTRHGHPIKGQVQFGKRPQIARCGGPKICEQCAKDAQKRLSK